MRLLLIVSAVRFLFLLVASTTPFAAAEISPPDQHALHLTPALAFSCSPISFASDDCGDDELLTTEKCLELCSCNEDTGAPECAPFGSCTNSSQVATGCQRGECSCKAVEARPSSTAAPSSVTSAVPPLRPTTPTPPARFALTCFPFDFVSDDCGDNDLLTTAQCKSLCTCDAATGEETCKPIDICSGAEVALLCKSTGGCECTPVETTSTKTPTST